MKPRVIIVDDEPDTLGLLEMILQVDYEIETFDDPIKLMLKENFEQPVKAAIVDLMMPGASGLVILQWLKEHAPEVRRIVLTAIGFVQQEAKSLAHVYLQKPHDIALSTLYDAIEGAGENA